jgi:hypothetical protein
MPKGKQGFQKGHETFKGAEKGWFKKGDKALTNRPKASPETIEKMRQAKLKNPTRYWLGKKRSEETNKKISETKKGKPNFKNRGENSNFWRGGITPKSRLLRESLECKEWKRACLKRDNYTCQKTKKKGGKLEVHHIQNFSQYPELRFSIDNGITLSVKEHKDFHKIYGSQNNTKEQLEEFFKCNNKCVSCKNTTCVKRR